MARADTRFKPDNTFLRAIARVIKSKRIEARLTQEQLATKSSMHWRYLQEIEAGASSTYQGPLKNLSVGIFYALSKGLELEVDTLMKMVNKNLSEHP